MNAPRRQATFIGEAVFGFAVSLTVAAVALTLSFVMPFGIVARLVVSGIGLAVVLRAIGRSDEKTGRVVVLAIWAALTAAVWLLGMALGLFVLMQATLVWLVRSLFSYSRLMEAAIDFGLSALAISFAVFAAARTESVFLAAWCFLLVQALHVSIPGLVRSWSAPRNEALPTGDPNRAFADAFRAADQALHRIAGQR